MRKIPAKYAPVVSSLLMSLFMCTLMSFMMTVIFAGIAHEQFMAKWANAFGYAFVVATPTVMIVAPLVQKLVRKIVEVA